jgi:hypothetical protein
MYETEIGTLERYSPLLSIRLPKYLDNTIQDANLRTNKNKLISFFDLHQTLRDFLVINSTVSSNRGISLFNTIPLNRSCNDALIPYRQCLMSKNNRYLTENEFTKETKLDRSDVIDLMNMIVYNLNAKTDKYSSVCSRFRFDEIKSIYHLQVDGFNIYRFKLLLQPGNSWFEASLKNVNGTFTLYDKIYRLSIYGKTSYCVKKYEVKPYCHCSIFFHYII